MDCCDPREKWAAKAGGRHPAMSQLSTLCPRAPGVRAQAAVTRNNLTDTAPLFSLRAKQGQWWLERKRVKVL